ncbi:hypothetical protein Hdeb2414_s0008g00294531 [Helianthus debilis subsp. tardiflorus]
MLYNEDVQHIFATKSAWLRFYRWMKIEPSKDGDAVQERLDFFKHQPGLKTWKKMVELIKGDVSF